MIEQRAPRRPALVTDVGVRLPATRTASGWRSCPLCHRPSCMPPTPAPSPSSIAAPGARLARRADGPAGWCPSPRVRRRGRSGHAGAGLGRGAGGRSHRLSGGRGLRDVRGRSDRHRAASSTGRGRATSRRDPVPAAGRCARHGVARSVGGGTYPGRHVAVSGVSGRARDRQGRPDFAAPDTSRPRRSRPAIRRPRTVLSRRRRRSSRSRQCRGVRRRSPSVSHPPRSPSVSRPPRSGRRWSRSPPP